MSGSSSRPSKPRSSKKSAPLEPFEEVLARARETLARQGLVRSSEWAKVGVPPAYRADLVQRLAAEGFEVLKGGLRVPADRQMEEALQTWETLPVKDLPKRIRGISKTEIAALAQAFARDGRAVWVLRGALEVLCKPGLPVLSPTERKAFGLAIKVFHAQVIKAERSRIVPKTLLLEDIHEALSGLVRPVPDVVSLEQRLVLEIRRLTRSDLGLCHVPELVQVLAMDHPVSRIHEVLLQAASVRRIELRPESGMGRLSPVESALCPLGRGDVRLSWTRLLDVTGA